MFFEAHCFTPNEIGSFVQTKHVTKCLYFVESTTKILRDYQVRTDRDHNLLKYHSSTSYTTQCAVLLQMSVPRQVGSIHTSVRLSSTASTFSEEMSKLPWPHILQLIQ